MTSAPEHPLLGLGSIGARLHRTLKGGRLSPSYLFEGADAEALNEAALAFAAGILTGAPPAQAQAAELERVLSGRHPDLQRLGKDKATVISVAALAPMLERAFMTPLEGAYQVIVIEPADAMEPEGIARYLKALEEPPPGTVFLLLSCNAERLPDTVLSRCRRVRFPPMPAQDLCARLCAEGADAEVATWAARCAGGSLGRARRVVEAGLHQVVAALCAAGLDGAQAVSVAAEDALRRVQHAAAERAATDDSAVDTKRQHVRVLLGDVLYALSVEARERAAGRPSTLLPSVDPPRALDLLAAWGRLATGVAANVTPAAVLIESLAVLRSTTSTPAGSTNTRVR